MNKATQIVMVKLADLTPHPKNCNNHSKEQIDRLKKIITYQGFRQPLLVSNLSGYIISGHGRLQAARELGYTEVPVTYQDFIDADQEFAHLVADNAIAEWANLDMSAIDTAIATINVDIDFLGLMSFSTEECQPQKPKDESTKEPKAKKYILEVEFDDELLMHDLREELELREFSVQEQKRKPKKNKDL